MKLKWTKKQDLISEMCKAPKCGRCKAFTWRLRQSERAAEQQMKYLWKRKKKLALCSLPAGSSFSPSQQTYLGQVPELEFCDSSGVSLEAELKEGWDDVAAGFHLLSMFTWFLSPRVSLHTIPSGLTGTNKTICNGWKWHGLNFL